MKFYGTRLRPIYCTKAGGSAIVNADTLVYDVSVIYVTGLSEFGE